MASELPIASLKTINLESCRICLMDEKLTPLFTRINVNDDMVYADYITEICDIQISSLDSKPQMICKKCIGMLLIILELQRKFKESTDILSKDNLCNPNLKRCRTCLTENSIFPLLYNRIEIRDETRFVDVLCKFFGVQISMDDYKPQWICLKCVTAIKTLIEFSKKSKYSEEILSSEIENSLKMEVEEGESKIYAPLEIMEAESENKNFDEVEKNSKDLCDPVEASANNIRKDESNSCMNLTVDDNIEDSEVSKVCKLLNKSKIRRNIHYLKKNILWKIDANGTKRCLFCKYKFQNSITMTCHIIKVHRKGKQCTICKNLFLLEETLSNHEKTCYIKEFANCSDISKTCKFCNYEWSCGKDLNNHVVKMHEKVLKQCIICSKSFLTTHLYGIHIQMFHRKRKCIYCSYTCELKKEYLVHVETEHPDKIQQCPTCSQEIISYEFKSHKNKCSRQHTNNIVEKNNISEKKPAEIFRLEFESPKICRFCDYEWCDFNNIKCHIYEKHPDKGKECSICKEIFVSDNVNNIISKHQSKCYNKNFADLKASYRKCFLCDYEWSSGANLNDHIKNVHANACTECYLCRNLFISKTSFTIHIQQWHSLTIEQYFIKEIFYCKICGSERSSIDDKNRHIMEKHKTNSNPISLKHNLPKTIQAVAKNINKCTLCDYETKADQDMIDHVDQSHQIRKLEYKYNTVCQFCGYNWKGYVDMNSHILKVHTENSKECSICKQIFISDNHIDISFHENKCYNKNLVHSEVNEKCKECDYEWTCGQDLNNHVIKNHDCILCLFCRNPFFNIRNYKMHLKMNHKAYVKGYHHQQKLASEECNLCISKTNFNQHIIEMHPFQINECFICRKVFFSKKFFGEHIILCKAEGNKFLCMQCGKMWKSLLALKVHKARVHTEELEQILEFNSTCAEISLTPDVVPSITPKNISNNNIVSMTKESKIPLANGEKKKILRSNASSNTKRKDVSQISSNNIKKTTEAPPIMPKYSKNTSKNNKRKSIDTNNDNLKKMSTPNKKRTDSRKIIQEKFPIIKMNAEDDEQEDIIEILSSDDSNDVTQIKSSGQKGGTTEPIILNFSQKLTKK